MGSSSLVNNPCVWQLMMSRHCDCYLKCPRLTLSQMQVRCEVSMKLGMTPLFVDNTCAVALLFENDNQHKQVVLEKEEMERIGDVQVIKLEHKLKLFGSRYFLLGWGSSTWSGGGQKVRYVPRKPGKTNFLVGYPGILAGVSQDCPKVTGGKKKGSIP